MSGMNLTLAQSLGWIPCGKLVGDGATIVARVHTDTRTLQAGHHDDRWPGLHEIDSRIHRPHQIDKLVIDDLDHHFAGMERLDDFLPDRFFNDGLGEVFDNFEIDVRFQQSRADFAHGFADVFFADSAPT